MFFKLKSILNIKIKKCDLNLIYKNNKITTINMYHDEHDGRNSE